MKPKCGIDGCILSHYAKGYCKAHYNRVWYTGRVGSVKISPKKNPRVRGICSIKKCINPHYANKLCQTHYLYARSGTIAHDGQRSCDFPGCKLVHSAKGYCAAHYLAFRGMVFNKKLIG